MFTDKQFHAILFIEINKDNMITFRNILIHLKCTLSPILFWGVEDDSVDSNNNISSYLIRKYSTVIGW